MQCAELREIVKKPLSEVDVLEIAKGRLHLGSCGDCRTIVTDEEVDKTFTKGRIPPVKTV